MHASALFAPDPQDVTALLRHAEATDGDDESVEPTHEQEEGVSDDESIDADAAESLDGADDPEAEELDDHETAYGIAAE